MVVITIADIPHYLRQSVFYEGLDTENLESFEVPDECYFNKPAAATVDDLLHLLKTMEFWGVNRSPGLLLEYMDMCDTQEEEYQAWTLLEAYEDKLPFLAQFRPFHGETLDRVKQYAIKKKNIKLLRQIFRLGYISPQNSYVEAIRANFTEGLRYLINQSRAANQYQVIPVESMFVEAISLGHIECLKVMFQTLNPGQLETNERLQTEAVKVQNLDVLHFLQKHNGGKLCDAVLTQAIKQQSVRCIQFALEEHVEWTEDQYRFLLTHAHRPATYSYAHSASCVDVLNLAFEHCVELPVDALELAMRYQGVEVMQLLLEHGAEWGVCRVTFPMWKDKRDIAVFALDHGCPWAPLALMAGAEAKNEEFVIFAMGRGLLEQEVLKTVASGAEESQKGWLVQLLDRWNKENDPSSGYNIMRYYRDRYGDATRVSILRRLMSPQHSSSVHVQDAVGANKEGEGEDRRDEKEEEGETNKAVSDAPSNHLLSPPLTTTSTAPPAPSLLNWSAVTMDHVQYIMETDVLRLAIDQGCVWGEMRLGHLYKTQFEENFKFAHPLGCPWEANAAAEAIKMDSGSVLELIWRDQEQGGAAMFAALQGSDAVNVAARDRLRKGKASKCLDFILSLVPPKVVGVGRDDTVPGAAVHSSSSTSPSFSQSWTPTEADLTALLGTELELTTSCAREGSSAALEGLIKHKRIPAEFKAAVHFPRKKYNSYSFNECHQILQRHEDARRAAEVAAEASGGGAQAAAASAGHTKNKMSKKEFKKLYRDNVLKASQGAPESEETLDLFE